MAAKLVREDRGLTTPHPILVEFKAPRPVYPMRLTALSGSNLNLELFILAIREAVPEGYDLEKVHSDSYYEANGGFVSRNTPVAMFRSGPAIGHPEIKSFMWEDCVLTKLIGEIPSHKMGDDIYFSFKRPKPYHGKAYTHRRALLNSVLYALLSGAVVLAILRVLLSVKRLPNKLNKYSLLLISPAVAAVVFLGLYLSFQKVEVVKIRGLVSSKELDYLSYEVSDILGNPTKRRSDAEMNEALKEADIRNPYTKGTAIVEDSPGNVTFEEDSNGLRIITYRCDGVKMHFRTVPLDSY